MARAASAPMKSYIRAPWSALVRVKSHKGIPWRPINVRVYTYARTGLSPHCAGRTITRA